MPVALADPPAVLVEQDGNVEAAPPRIAVKSWRCVVAASKAAVGTLSFGAVLSAVAAVPGGPVLALGWMLEAAGRAAGESGSDRRPRLGPLLRAAAVVAGVGAVIWLATVPVRVAAGVAADAAVIAPFSPAAAGWHAGSVTAAVLLAVHLALWLLAGGRTGWFRPLRNVLRVARDPRGCWRRLGDQAAAVWRELDPVGGLWLGVRGIAVGLGWLLLPSLLLANQGGSGGAEVWRVVGAAWLIVVLPLVPAAQANLAAARLAGPWNSVRAGLSPRRAWGAWRRRPARWCGVLLAVGAGSLPLYVLAVVELPADAAWLLTPACVAAIFPGRLLAGWTRRNLIASPPARKRWLALWLPAAWALAAAYVGILFLTQFTSADGPEAVIRQPGFLTPVPFRVGG